jgi:hypothetical protein
MMKLALVLLASCAVDGPALPGGHPANPAAPIGRLADPPEALGSSTPATAPPPMPMHHHHGS